MQHRLHVAQLLAQQRLIGGRTAGRRGRDSGCRGGGFAVRCGGARRGMNTIRQFRFGRLRIVHMGDTGCMPDENTLAALHGCDALLLPIGGYYTVDAEEAFAIAKKIAPRCIVPMHYRGEGFGFDELGTLDAFTALFAAADVCFLETDAFTLTAAEPRGVIVPRLS